MGSKAGTKAAWEEVHRKAMRDYESRLALWKEAMALFQSAKAKLTRNEKSLVLLLAELE